MSDADLHRRFVQAIRSALVEHDGPPNVIPARTFQTVLTRLGLTLGNPIVDNIMLNCDILESGVVDVSRLLHLAAGANTDAPASVGTLSQAERVRAHSRSIHRAFIEFDSGRSSVQKFIERLSGLGIEQTLESRRVLRQIPVSFSTLLHALTLVDSTDITDQAAGATQRQTGTTASIIGGGSTPGGPVRRHRGLGLMNGAHDRSTDVVTWKKDQLAKNRGLDARLWNTRALDYNTDLWKGDVIADVLVHNQEQPLQRFETESQHAALTGIGEPDVPITSAGYQTADKGLVREQLYSLIRQLDQGAITIATFRQHLHSMRIPVPPRAERHLHLYAANGRVNFKEFVVAFEDYLEQATVHVAEPDHSPVRPASTEPWWRTGGRGGKHNPRLQRGYGDIITWEHSEGGGEARDITREHEKATFGRRLGFLYGGEIRSRNFLVSVCVRACVRASSTRFGATVSCVRAQCACVRPQQFCSWLFVRSGMGRQPVRTIRDEHRSGRKQCDHMGRTRLAAGGACVTEPTTHVCSCTCVCVCVCVCATNTRAVGVWLGL